MAEARSVALVSLELKRGAELTVDDEGVHLRLHLTIPPARVMRSEIAKRAHRLRNFFLDTLFPIGPLALAVCMVVFMSVVLLADEQSWWRTGPLAAFVWQVSHLFPWYDGISRYHKLALITAWAVFVGFLLLVLLQRAALRALLSWRGWMYAPPGKRPLSVKLWGAAVTLLSGRHPLLYSFQSALPKLPLPALEATVKRYLRSLEPCMTDTEMAEMRSLADDFLRKEGPTLQRYLRLKHLMSDNYVVRARPVTRHPPPTLTHALMRTRWQHEWWEKYVYLRGRSPIMINSNYYCTDSYRVQPSTDQASRAAVLTRCCLEFKQQLDREELRPMLMQGIVPLCMDQYRRTFSTTRVPGRECDTLKHYDPSSSRHVAVLCRNHVYCFAVERVDHSMLEAWEIEDQMRAILEVRCRRAGGGRWSVAPHPACLSVQRLTPPSLLRTLLASARASPWPPSPLWTAPRGRTRGRRTLARASTRRPWTCWSAPPSWSASTRRRRPRSTSRATCSCTATAPAAGSTRASRSSYSPTARPASTASTRGQSAFPSPMATAGGDPHRPDPCWPPLPAPPCWATCGSTPA